MGLAPQMSPNQPRGQILRRFPEPYAKRPSWLKIKGAETHLRFGQLCGQTHHDLLYSFSGGFRSSPHPSMAHTAPIPPEGQRWLKRKRLSAHPKKSCWLNCVVTLELTPGLWPDCLLFLCSVKLCEAYLNRLELLWHIPFSRQRLNTIVTQCHSTYV